MHDSIQTLLSFTTSAERRAWLTEHFTSKDEMLLYALLEESYDRNEHDPRTTLVIAEAVADAAALWNDPPTQALALRIEANARSFLGEHTFAIERFEQAITQFRAHGLELEAARAMVGQVNSLLYLGRYADALTSADWAISVFSAEKGEPLDLGFMLANRGNLLARLHRYDEALGDYAAARSHFATLGHQQYQAMIEANEANIYRDRNDFRQAEQLFSAARSHFAAIGNSRSAAHVDHSLAYLYFCQGNYQQALITANRARSFFNAQESSVDVAYIDLDRCEIHLALNLWQEALDLARTVRSIFAQAQMRWETARLWLNEATALARLADVVQADQALQEARQLFDPEKNSIWLAVTDLYQASFDTQAKRFAAARVAAEQAREVFTQAGVYSRAAQCELVLGQVAMGEKNLVLAEQHFQQALVAVGAADLPAITYACQRGLGWVRRQQGQTTLALNHYRQAIVDIERLQAAIGAEDHKIAFRSDKLHVYEAVTLLCLDLQTAEGEVEAFETVEKAKSRALLDALARQSAPQASAPLESELLANIAELKRELNWYYNRLNTPEPAPPPAASNPPDPDGTARAQRQVAEWTDAISQREQTLRHLLKQWRSPELITAPHNPLWTVSAHRLCSTLPAGTLLLEFFVAGEELIVFGLCHTGLWSQRLAAPRAEIVALLQQFHFQISKFSYGAGYRQRHAAMLLQGVNDSLQGLYAALIQPIIERVAADHVIIAAHDLLHGVPFHALFDGKRYWLEDKTISYTPSATVLQRVMTHQTEPRLSAPRIFGIADATIPYAETEARALAQLFPQAQSFTGESASVGNFLQAEEQPAFLHISSHAIFRADNPLFSAFKMSDGWVTVDDIYGLSTVAPLVTLSACETGRNQIMLGDELVGLCRGFFSAGAKSLVVSQWNVDDQSTAQFMAHLYQNLMAGQPIHLALQTAQQKMLQAWPHPYYWAPFFLTGNPWTYLAEQWRTPLSA